METLQEQEKNIETIYLRDGSIEGIRGALDKLVKDLEINHGVCMADSFTSNNALRIIASEANRILVSSPDSEPKKYIQIIDEENLTYTIIRKQ